MISSNDNNIDIEQLKKDHYKEIASLENYR